MSDTQLVYRFTPGEGGAFLSGVPQRDLTARDMARLRQRGRLADVTASGLYTEVRSDPAEDARTEIETATAPPLAPSTPRKSDTKKDGER